MTNTQNPFNTKETPSGLRVVTGNLHTAHGMQDIKAATRDGEGPQGGMTSAAAEHEIAKAADRDAANQQAIQAAIAERDAIRPLPDEVQAMFARAHRLKTPKAEASPAGTLLGADGKPVHSQKTDSGIVLPQQRSPLDHATRPASSTLSR